MKKMTDYRQRQMQKDAKVRLVLDLIKAGVPFDRIMRGMRMWENNILWVLVESARWGNIKIIGVRQLSDAMDFASGKLPGLVKSDGTVIDPLSEKLIEGLNSPDSALVRLATDGNRIVLMASPTWFPPQEPDEQDEDEPGEAMLTLRYVYSTHL